MEKVNKSEVFKKAWSLFKSETRKEWGLYTFAQCLKRAWSIISANVRLKNEKIANELAKATFKEENVRAFFNAYMYCRMEEMVSNGIEIGD